MSTNEKSSVELAAEENSDLPLSMVRDILTALREEAIEEYVFD